MSNDSLIIRDEIQNNKAIEFCKKFKQENQAKYIFGRNDLAQTIMSLIKVDGVIDDFTDEKEYLGKPVVPIESVPNNALVVIVVTAKPFIAEKRVSSYQFEHLDYFSFYKYSGLPLKNIMFWDGMVEDIKTNRTKYESIYKLLNDQISKNQFYNIVNFRFSHDLDYMRGFISKEESQYFEEFLNLDDKGEVFVDVGGYDGYTSQEFIKRSPHYKKVHIFEPEKKNLLLAKERLKGYKNINYHQIGLSNKKDTLKFDINGSSSKISDKGEVIIQVDKLDDIIDEKVTFIKMDIEGAESFAIEGAKLTIKRYHPKLALSVYHRADDFWKIPQQILEIRDDYNIYMRHYTEGISETVMFFIPKFNK